MKNILQRDGEWFEISPSAPSSERFDRDRALDLLRRLSQEPGNTAVMHRILAECDHATFHASHSELLRTLALRIASGHLQVARRSLVRLPASAARRQEPAPPPPVSVPATVPKTSWIEIELIDEAGRPIPDETFFLVDEDGRILREGKLDRNGFARIDPIEPAPYWVKFPYVR